MKARNFHYAVTLVSVLFFVGSAARLFAQQPASGGPATLDMTLVKPETEEFSSERLERLHTLMQQVVDAEAASRGRDAAGAAWEGRGLPHVRNARCGQRCANDARHDFPRVFDDQASDWGRDDAAL